MNKKQTTKKETLSFEQALERLDTIVSELESDDIHLKRSIDLYEEGMRLFQLCQKELNQTEHRVYLLKQGLHQDSLNTKPDTTPRKKEQQDKKQSTFKQNDLIQKNFDLFDDAVN